MKNLYQFLMFDLVAFLCGKTLLVTGISPLSDHASGEVIGTRVECVITRDDTVYRAAKDSTISTNLYERLFIKIKHPNSVSVTVGDEVEVINGTAVVYGDFNNKLSLTADGLVVTKPADKGSKD